MNLIYGEPKVGKTAFAINYLSRNSYGYKAYFIDLDFNVAGKLRTYTYVPEMFYYQTATQENFWSVALSVPQGEICIVDCLSRFAESSADTSALTQFLKDIRKLDGVTTIILHHQNKTNKSYQGSNLIESLVDQTCCLEHDSIEIKSSRYQIPRKYKLLKSFPDFFIEGLSAPPIE